jgi:16S rRNA processing protein RimM
MAADSNELVVIGKVTSVYGVKGWVKIHSYTEPVENFLRYQDYYLDQADQWQPIAFDQLKRHQKGLVGLMEGIETRESASTYCQCDIAILASQMSSLDDGEFYWHELEGLSVWTRDVGGNELLLGKLHHMIETGANDVLVVRSSKGSLDKRERLIPYLPGQVIREIDIEASVIKVDWDPEF